MTDRNLSFCILFLSSCVIIRNMLGSLIILLTSWLQHYLNLLVKNNCFITTFNARNNTLISIQLIFTLNSHVWLLSQLHTKRHEHLFSIDILTSVQWMNFITGCIHVFSSNIIFISVRGSQIVSCSIVIIFIASYQLVITIMYICNYFSLINTLDISFSLQNLCTLQILFIHENYIHIFFAWAAGP